MYTVERIENDIFVLEDRNSKKIININKEEMDLNVKVNDIVYYDYEDMIYKLNNDETIIIKNDIRSKFNRLKK